jgi:eukaryotic-like serine/threonine-protein kinase
VVKTIKIDPSEAGQRSPARVKAERLLGELVSGRYRFEHVIAASETGAVYRAEHVAMRLRVVVKILYPDAPADDAARFEREAIAGAHVRHQNVAGATDSGKLDDGSLYLVLEHVAGTTLRDVVGKGPLPLARAATIAKRLAAALAAVHEQGIVHRDVQPSNVMLAGPQGDDVKLVDFGLASVDLARLRGDAAPAPPPASAKPEKALTAVGLVVGASAYSPPEAALGTTFLDARSDLYSFGVVVYEMLAGKRPFAAQGPPELFAQQRAGDPPALAPELGVPAALEAVVTRLLARDASARFQSATEVVEALDAALPSPSRAPPPSADEFVPRAPTTTPPPAKDGLGELRDAALDAVARGVDSVRSLVGRVARTAGPAAKKPLQLPTWMIVALASGVPLAFTIAWLVFRPAPASPVGASHAAPTAEERVDALPEHVPAVDVPPASSGGIIIVAPAPSGSAAAPGGFEGLDAAAWRDRLRDTAKAKDWARAVKPIQALATLDPASFRDPNVIGWAVSVAVALETTGGADADLVFETLSQRAGTDGLDLLFEIVRGRGGTKGSKRAADLLRNPEVAVMEPPPLRAVFELHDAPCDKKPALYEHAVKDGDQRALTELRAMREAECDRRRRNVDPCCFAHEPLDKAIAELKARLTK